MENLIETLSTSVLKISQGTPRMFCAHTYDGTIIIIELIGLSTFTFRFTMLTNNILSKIFLDSY